MTNLELETKLTFLVRQERASTEEILSLIREGEKRRLFLERGHPNVYEWLVRGFGYSHAAAYRRIQSARLLECVPEVKEKLASGDVNLTTLAQLQTAIRQEEKRVGEPATGVIKQTLLEKIAGKTASETDQILRTEFPETKPKKEKIRAIDKENSQVTLVLENEVLNAIKRVKELLSHSHPNASYSELIKHLALDYVKKMDPLQKMEPKKSAMDKQCSKIHTPSKAIPAATRRAAFQNAQGKCEYRDPQTGRVCGSREQVQLDHKLPRALGGMHDLKNIRCLCRQHNILAAEQMLGAELMNRYRIADHKVGP